MTAARLLPRRDATEGADPIVQSLLPRRDDGVMGKAIAVAFALHAVLFFVDIPERAGQPEPPRSVASPPLSLEKFVLRPPDIIETPPPERPSFTPQPWFTDTPPEESGPVDEEYVSDFAAVEPGEIEDLLAAPIAPPAPPGPAEIFDPGVTAPVLDPDCKVTPDYPELGRQARREGTVILRAIIGEDGSVRAAEVLSTRPPGYGFEDAAIDAVLQWCYEPATRHGRPVDVYFTIYVTFRLQ